MSLFRIRDYHQDDEEQVRILIDIDGFVLPSNQLPPIGFVAVCKIHEDIEQVVGYIGGYRTYGNNAFVDVAAVSEAARDMGIGVRLAYAMATHLLDNDIYHVRWLIADDAISKAWHRKILGNEAEQFIASYEVIEAELQVIQDATRDVIIQRALLDK
jgi:GNAT superfamily N-acetyltransferase